MEKAIMVKREIETVEELRGLMDVDTEKKERKEKQDCPRKKTRY